MRIASRPKLAIQTGAQAGLLTLFLGIASEAILAYFDFAVLSWPVFLGTIAIAAPLAGLLTAFFVHFAISRRMARVAEILQRHAEDSSLRRLPDLGDDEVGAIGRAVNKMLANLTSMQVQMIEQGAELRSTREELALKEQLAAKTAELEQNLRERALFFDILHTSASEGDLVTVLNKLTEMLGISLDLRECLLLLSDAKSERLVARAAYGFGSDDEATDRIVLFSEGPLGAVARDAHPVVVENLATSGHDPLLWNLVPRRGTLVAFPIVHRDETIGVLAATRDEAHAFSDMELSLMSAICDQVGLAIRHAQLVDELRRGSQHDDLTGLGNRRLLRQRLDGELLRAQRFGLSVSVLAIDLDRFKLLNDRHGHPTGDAALRKLAGVFKRNLRRIDTVARIGGEEFIILLPRTDAEEAARVAGKIRELVENTEFPGGRDQPGGRMTISIGVATLAPDETGDQMLSRADRALYQAKEKGRNRVEVALQAAGSARSLTRSRI